MRDHTALGSEGTWVNEGFSVFDGEIGAGGFALGGTALLICLGIVGGGIGDPDREDFLDTFFIPALLTQ
jgi:hypothetical protein